MFIFSISDLLDIHSLVGQLLVVDFVFAGVLLLLGVAMICGCVREESLDAKGRSRCCNRRECGFLLIFTAGAMIVAGLVSNSVSKGQSQIPNAALSVEEQ